MINFQTELDKSQSTTLVVSAPKVTVTTRRPEAPGRLHESRTHLLSTSDTWTWQQLRDYVVARIEAKAGGSFPRNHNSEMGIFKGFVARYGANSGAIARFAMDTCDGMWKGAPVGVTRFCKNSDPYFGDVILARLSSE